MRGHDLSDVPEDDAILRIATWCEEYPDRVAQVVINKEQEMLTRYVRKLNSLSCRLIDITPGMHPRTTVLRVQWVTPN